MLKEKIKDLSWFCVLCKKKHSHKEYENPENKTLMVIFEICPKNNPGCSSGSGERALTPPT